jgi:2-polyprenyl-6-methoxyphenol hydroxylase-like FAD-dependent oxidoreductase
MKIGIAGAGIGGLAAAALLAQDGHSVEIFDRFEAPKPVGSGLVMQPVGMAVLDALGAGDGARRLGTPLTAMRGREADHGRLVLSVDYGQAPDRVGLGIHRAALFDMLHRAALDSGANITPGCAITGRDGQVLLSRGKRLGPFDLIVDASGAGSMLSPLIARPLAYGAIWATVPWPTDTDLPQDRLSQCYRRADRMLGVLPIGALPAAPKQPLAAVFYSLPASAEPAWRATAFDIWRAGAVALWPRIAPFLPPRLTHADFAFARYTHGSLSRPYDDGLAHIGDAAHRASPQLGQGANMALLDAQALALALRRARGVGDRDEALRLYAGARRWHVAAYQTLSAAFTPQYQSDSRVLPMIRDHILAPLSRTWPIPRILTRLVCGDLVPPMPALTPRAGPPRG